MAFVIVGYWCGYTIISSHPVTEYDIRLTTNYELRLVQYRHVRDVIGDHVLDSVDVVYPERFYYPHETESYMVCIGEWNGIRIFAHVDDIQLMDLRTVSLIIFLARVW